MGYEEITISHANVSATIAPARGALVTGLKVNGKDVLYLDRASFDDLPGLFPSYTKPETGVIKAIVEVIS